MPPHTPEQEELLAELRSLSLHNYRQTRWEAIDKARLAGLSWPEIADAQGVTRPAVIRMYTDGARQYGPDARNSRD